MAETIRGKGVISGIAMGKIMLAGQNLDGYLVNYQPEAKETELQKAQAALTAVAEVLHESIERLKKTGDDRAGGNHGSSSYDGAGSDDGTEDRGEARRRSECTAGCA